MAYNHSDGDEYNNNIIIIIRDDSAKDIDLDVVCQSQFNNNIKFR